jgi:hypothetical protein
MANRPCRTDTDLKSIWRLVLPGTPLPSCEAPKNPDNDEKPNEQPPRIDDKPQ